MKRDLRSQPSKHPQPMGTGVIMYVLSAIPYLHGSYFLWFITPLRTSRGVC